MLMPLTVGWVERHEQVILNTGIPLSPELAKAASAMGISDPDRVRVKSVDIVPWPGNRLMQRAGAVLGWRQSYTAGLCARYGIYVRHDFAESREVLLHELAHTAQYERLGGIRAFLEKYLAECAEHGYAFSPMEIEAREFACSREGIGSALGAM